MKVFREKPPFYDKTLLNANRLHADSKLLAEHGRAHSSIILGVFAIEELGKALITRWAVRNRASKREFP
ncbi:MAG TPA: AbiV family abortive infection protein, partial [Brevundimonas sp.]|nr:AbiV family abortive infection protein [Brevundimonas sp.]